MRNNDDLGLFPERAQVSAEYKREQELIRIAYRNVFGSQDGRRVLDDLARESGFLGSCHVPGDPCSSAFNEGMRDLFLRIFHFSGYSMEDFDVRRNT